MFKNYIATQDDLEAIEDALEYLWRPELDFIFRDRSKIERTLVISYDSEHVYVWSRDSDEYSVTRISHSLEIEDKFQSYWRANLQPKELLECLPKKWQQNRFAIPKISGGLLTPFIELQKKKNRPHNPYATRESYLATIIHEFGHVHYNAHKLWCYMDVDESLKLLQKALDLYRDDEIEMNNFRIRVPTHQELGELFAFCTDYSAASIFRPQHKKDIDKYFAGVIPNLKNEEKRKDLHKQDSVLNNSHTFAAIVGRLLLSRNPQNWPDILLKGVYL